MCQRHLGFFQRWCPLHPRIRLQQFRRPGLRLWGLLPFLSTHHDRTLIHGSRQLGTLAPFPLRRLPLFYIFSCANNGCHRTQLGWQRCLFPGRTHQLGHPTLQLVPWSFHIFHPCCRSAGIFQGTPLGPNRRTDHKLPCNGIRWEMLCCPHRWTLQCFPPRGTLKGVLQLVFLWCWWRSPVFQFWLLFHHSRRGDLCHHLCQCNGPRYFIFRILWQFRYTNNCDYCRCPPVLPRVQR